jgi:hypothetical protein
MATVKVGERELEVRDTLDGIMAFNEATKKLNASEGEKRDDLASLGLLAEVLAVVLAEWDLDGKTLNEGVNAAWLKANVRGIRGLPDLFAEVLKALGMRTVKPGEEQSLPTGIS